jgi:hypothetical protein
LNGEVLTACNRSTQEQGTQQRSNKNAISHGQSLSHPQDHYLCSVHEISGGLSGFQLHLSRRCGRDDEDDLLAANC